MVKKFRRAAAGLDEQLPSDLRPPSTLRETCDYLFDDLVGNAESLGSVHHFVWDRTRAIRNDFSIQQITKPSDVEIAIECYERIARFHILSLHQLAVPEKPYDKYDWYQEREQLDRTLLSLMQYYDDNRTRVNCKNEPEFRAYCIIFQIQDPTPDLEERVNCWDDKIKSHPRVRTALDLYNAACNILDSQGPLKPRAAHVVARADWNDFFSIVESNRVSYTMACVAEIYFNMVRKLTLNSIWRAFKVGMDVSDFTMEYLTELLRFDDLDETRKFCEHYTFGFKETESGEDFLDLNSVQGKVFPDATRGLNAQMFSDAVVESKRCGRTFPAVIRGLSFAAAQAQGMVVAEERDDEEMAMDGDDSLFVPDTQMNATAPTFAPKPSPFAPQGSSPFGQPVKADDSKPAPSPFGFGTPSTQNDKPQAGSENPSAESKAPTLAPQSGLKESIFAQKPASSWGKPSSSPWGAPAGSSSAGQPTTSPFAQQPSKSPFASSPFEKPKEGGLDSVHSPSSFSWGKPSPSPWAQPLPANAAEAPKKEEQPQSKADPSSIFDSPFAKTATDPAPKPLFSFGTPEAPPANAEAPKSTSPFASFSSPVSQPAASNAAKPSNPFAGLNAATPKETPAEAEKPKVQSTTSSIFSKSPEPDTQPSQPAQPLFSSAPTPPAPAPVQQKEAEVSKPTFGFPPSAPASQEPKAAPTQKPLFSFSSTTPPGSPQVHDKAEQSTQKTTGNTTSQPEAPKFGAPSSSATANTAPQPARTPSFSFSSPNQPKKPSPLSQSFTAPSETQERVANKPETTTKPSFFGLGKSVEQPSKVVEAQKPSISPTQILQNLAEEMILDVDKGLLRQFVEYQARSAIMSVYDEVYLDSIRGIADRFRTEKLAIRYGKRWRQNAWKLRLNRQARDKRDRKRTAHRHREALDARKKQQEKVNAVDDFLKSQALRFSQASTKGASRFSERASRDESMLRSSEASNGVHNGVSRDMPPPAARPSADAPKKRSVNRVDDIGKVAKPTVSPRATPNTNRASFLGFSMQRPRVDSSASKPSSRSSYFRMKAMGINPNGPSVPTPNMKKRAREDDESEIAESTPVAKKSKTPPRMSTAGSSRMRSASFRSQSSVQSSILELSPGPENNAREVRSTSKSEQDDEALFARSRAARKALSESANWYRSEVEKADDADSVVSGHSQVSASASLQRARDEARLRASQCSEVGRFGMSGMSGMSGFSQHQPDVPAYRLRESRFIPREQYGRAIEIAKERAANRLRPQSVLNERSGTTTPRAQQSPPQPATSFPAFSRPRAQVQSQSQPPSQPQSDLQSELFEEGQVQQNPPQLPAAFPAFSRPQAQLQLPSQPQSQPQSAFLGRQVQQNSSQLPLSFQSFSQFQPPTQSQIEPFEEQAQVSPTMPLSLPTFSQIGSQLVEEEPIAAIAEFESERRSPNLAATPAPVVDVNVDTDGDVVVDVEQPDSSQAVLNQVSQNDTPPTGDLSQRGGDQNLSITTELLQDVSAPAASLWSFSNLNSPSTFAPLRTGSATYQPAFSPSVGFGFMPAFGEAAFGSAGAETERHEQMHDQSRDINEAIGMPSPQIQDYQEDNPYMQEVNHYPELDNGLATADENDNSVVNGDMHDGSRMLNDAARAALAMDSSYVDANMLNQDMDYPQAQEQTQSNGQHELDNNALQIDPDLLDMQNVPTMTEQTAAQEPEPEDKPVAKKKEQKAVASMNPFALLANGTGDTSEDASEDGDESDEDVEEDEDDKGHSVPNDLIQDRLDDRRTLDELEEDEVEDNAPLDQAGTDDEEMASEGDEEIYDEDESAEYDSEQGDEDDEEDEEQGSEDDDGQDYSAYAPRNGMSAQQLQQSGVIKGGTGQSAEDAFELSD